MSHSLILALRPVSDMSPSEFGIFTALSVSGLCSEFADDIDTVHPKDWSINLQWFVTVYEQFKFVESSGNYFVTITLKDLEDLIDDRIDKVFDFIGRNAFIRSSDDFFELNRLVNFNRGFHICFLTDVSVPRPETFDWFLHNLYDYFIKHKIDEIILRVEGLVDYHC